MPKTGKRKIIFMGSPEFGAIILNGLLQDKDNDILCVVTQSDKKAGRGLKICEPPVKILAKKFDLPIIQPDKLMEEDVIYFLRVLQPDFIIVAAYGKILPDKILEIPKFGCINVHASLLPAYRGAAPIQRAIMDNFEDNAVTGVSIMKMIREMDAGPVYARREVKINKLNCEELTNELAMAGSELLGEVLNDFSRYNPPKEQSDIGISYAPKLKDSEFKINEEMSIKEIDSKVRALSPKYGAKVSIMFNNGIMKDFKILKGECIFNKDAYEKGSIFKDKKHLYICGKDGLYSIKSLIPLNGKKMNIEDFLNGLKIDNGLCGKVV